MSVTDLDQLQKESRHAETTAVSASIDELYQRGEQDISFFASLCLPTVCIYSLPVFYLAVWQLLIKRNPKQIGKLLRFALGLPRGHAKTTFIKILIVWLLVYDKFSFALIICSNKDLAENLLADIHDILRSPNIVAVYGDWEGGLAIDSADTKKATYHNRGVTLVARGWSAGIRGLNLQNDRPDLIFCDDVQTRENDESVTERAKLLNELAGTIFKAIAPRGNRLIIYVGNMYSDQCLLQKFRKNKSWLSMVTGAILSDGSPLWPELFSLEELMESYYHDEELGLAHIWFAEVMNDPASHKLSLLPNPLPICDDEEFVSSDGNFIIIDPAGFRKNSDNNQIVVGQKHDMEAYVVDSDAGIMDPKELIKRAFEKALRWDVTLIGVESVAYQQTLGFWIKHFMGEFPGLQNIQVVELHPHGRSKETRIRQLVLELYNKSVFIKDPETRRLFTWYASIYKIGEKDNKDDLLDACAYILDVRTEYWHLILPPTKSTFDSTALVVADNTPF
jgi:hypothetical protein